MESLTILTELIASGPIGLIAAIAIWTAYKKDRQLQFLYERTLKREEQRGKRDRLVMDELNQTLIALTEHADTHEGDDDGG